MATLVLDPYIEWWIKDGRIESGVDRFDEMWDGVLVIDPLADNEHAEIRTGVMVALRTVIGWSGPDRVYPGVNVSDREDDWEHNYRIPDVAVFLRETTARNRDTHWLGGPDFAVEIISKGDRARDKLPFYAAVNTRELLVIDRYPWALELYRLRGRELVLVGTSRPEAPETLTSEVVPLTFRLVPGEKRPAIAVARREGGESWTI